MRFLPARKPKPPVRVDFPTSIRVQHDHVIERRPQPKPVMLTGHISDEMGRHYVLSSQSLYGNSIAFLDFPLVWMTGRDSDNGRQARIELRLEY